MEILNNKKDLEKALKGLTSKDIKSGSITVTIYKGKSAGVLYDVGANIYTHDSDHGIYYYKEGSRIGGGGYDRWSTALSEGLNLFKNIWKIKTTLKYKKVNEFTGFGEYYTRKDRRVYGLYKDGSISYGIGVDAVLYAVCEGLSNLKLTNAYYGKNEDRFSFEVKEVK